jgi:hypothetical protein
MIGTLVKSNSSMKWIPFMVRYEIGTKFFGIIKRYDYAYVHPYIPDLPKDINTYKIGDKVEFFFDGLLHVKIIRRINTETLNIDNFLKSFD